MPSLSHHCCIKSNVSRWDWIPSSSCSDFNLFALYAIDSGGSSIWKHALAYCPPRTRVCRVTAVSRTNWLTSWCRKPFLKRPLIERQARSWELGIRHISTVTRAHLTETTLPICAPPQAFLLQDPLLQVIREFLLKQT